MRLEIGRSHLLGQGCPRPVRARPYGPPRGPPLRAPTRWTTPVRNAAMSVETIGPLELVVRMSHEDGPEPDFDAMVGRLVVSPR